MNSHYGGVIKLQNLWKSLRMIANIRKIIQRSLRPSGEHLILFSKVSTIWRLHFLVERLLEPLEKSWRAGSREDPGSRETRKRVRVDYRL